MTGIKKTQELLTGVKTRKNTDAYSAVIGDRDPHAVEKLDIVSKASEMRIEEPCRLYMTIKNFLEAIKSDSQVKIHKYLATTVLKHKINEATIEGGAILLAEEIRKEVNKLESKIPHISGITDFECERNGMLFTLRDWVDVTEKEKNNLNKKCFTKNGVFIPLDAYIKTVGLLPNGGMKYAKKLKKEDVGTDSTFWFSRGERNKSIPFFHSPAFTGLALLIWKTRVKKRIEFSKKYPPCVISKTFKTTTSIISAKRHGELGSEKVSLITEKEVVGSVSLSAIPTVEPGLHDKIFRGLGRLNTVVCHKALRHAIALPFIQKREGVEDFRVKQYDGGIREIGEEIGISSRNQVSELGDILHALKHLVFPNDRGGYILEGNFINLTQIKSKATGRRDGIILTIEPALVGIGEVDCRGSLLIPIATALPPVKDIVPNQYHANLYHLQMLVLEEFSNQSIEFYQYSQITITKKPWDDLLTKVSIPLNYRSRILDCWMSGGNDAPQILEHKGENQYDLGKSYAEPRKFLIEQGKIRLEQREKGYNYAKKRKRLTHSKRKKIK